MIKEIRICEICEFTTTMKWWKYCPVDGKVFKIMKVVE